MKDTTVIPRRLAAASPGWTESTDVVVVGSGVAGLSLALRLRSAGHRVLVVTKADRATGSTRWAQGGVAAAVGIGDSPEDHLRDTMTAGGGLCDEAAVRVLVTEGPQRLRELMSLGAEFDRDSSGRLSLTREGGHGRRRVAHAGGDATGAEVQRTLEHAVLSDPGIRLVEHALALDLLTDARGRAAGVTVHVLGEGMPDGVGAVLARAVVIATGGLGQVYAATTNPEVSTGDGLALALRAGAVAADLEFIQFHPTALWTGGGGQLPLVTEALRGEGAILVDADGERVMAGVHPLEDLAPRDVVAKQMSRRMTHSGVEHLYLDARGLGRARLRERFPTVLAACAAAGIDPAEQLVPVAPAAHYSSGGIRTDLAGRTTVPGLYACGEVACTGVHGANRLASNSLLEGLVFAARIGRDLAGGLPRPADPVDLPDAESYSLVNPARRADMQAAMSRGAGVLRDAAGLDAAATALSEAAADKTADAVAAAWETTNLAVVAGAIVSGAAFRTETRGCHWRSDFPGTDEGWAGSVLVSRDDEGLRRRVFRPSRRVGSSSEAVATGSRP